MYLTYDEKLEQEASDCGIKIIEKYLFKSPRIKGVYCNNTIAISKVIESKKEMSCILAEELGHYYTSHGDILNQTIDANRKQEYHARLWAYNRQIGLIRIIKAYEAGCLNLFEMAEFLDVTEEFLQECLESYRKKFGVYTKLDNYIIYFEPNLAVMKMV